MAITITEPSATLPNGTISRFVPVHNPILFTITSGSTSIKIDIHRTDASPSIINTNDLIFLAGTDFTFVFDASPYVKSILNNDLDITYTADATKEDTEGVLPFYIVVTEYPEASPIVTETSNTFYGVNSVLQIQNRYGNNQGNYLVDDNADVANLVDFLIGSNRLRYWIGYPFSLPYLNNDVTSSAINIDGELVFTTSIADSVNHYILSLQTEGARNIYLQSLLAFSSVWITTNAGSDSDQIVLPLISSGSYNFVVDWGDGNQDTITAYNQAEVTHTYATSGTKGLNIIGTIQGWQFNDSGDKLKLLSISNWGSLDINSSKAFEGCTNLSLVGATGMPNFSSPAGLTAIFRYCSSLTTIGNVENWDLSIISSLNGCFTDCSSLNDSNINNWDVSGVSNFTACFSDCTVFNQSISSWDVSSATNFGNMFADAIAFNNGVAGSGTGTMNFTAYPLNSCSFTSMFARCTNFNQNLSNWDVSKASTFITMFIGCTSFNNGGLAMTWTMTGNTTDTFSSMFQNCSVFNQDLSSWNVSSATTLNSMFSGASAFNNGGGATPLNWAMGGVVGSFGSMFSGATSFNQDISTWNTTAAPSFVNMFFGATAFNNGGVNNLNSWSTANIGNLQNTFSGATAFNRDVSGWDVSGVTNFSGTFNSATSFNQDLSLWNVSSATTFSSMFSGASAFNNGGAAMTWTMGATALNVSAMFFNASAFNQDISTWTQPTFTGAMSSMFQNANAFNNGGVNDLNGWDVSGVTLIDSLFQSSAFNRDIGSWNVSNVTNFNLLFTNNAAFNQDLSSWDVSSATTLNSMFNNATAFDQNLSSWNILTMTTAAGMFDSSGLSQGNYDNLLIGWEGTLQATYSGGVGYPNSPALGAAGVNFTTATSGTERTSLVNNFNFTITDAGGNP